MAYLCGLWHICKKVLKFIDYSGKILYNKGKYLAVSHTALKQRLICLHKKALYSLNRRQKGNK